MSDNTNNEEAKLELNAKTIKRAGDALATMKEEFMKRTPKRPAEELIRQYINEIDELSKLGASLPQIYERLNRAVSLGITPNSFGVYVRRVRKESGSERYSPRTAKDKAEAAPAAMSETNDAPAMAAEANSVAQVEQHDCKELAKRREYKNNIGTYYWQCRTCGKNFKDANGEIGEEIKRNEAAQ